jgi:hypothetical protein
MKCKMLLSQTFSFFLIGISFLSALLSWYFVFTYGLSIPVGDQWWDTVHLAVLTRQGNLTPDHFLVYAEGHRWLNIRVYAWAMTLLTKYNPLILNFTTWLISIFNAILALLIFIGSQRTGINLSRNEKLAALALFSLALFCITHGQSWIDFYFAGWQLSLSFILLAGVYIRFSSGRFKGFFILTLISILASFSMGLGLASWFCIPIMALANTNFRKVSFLIAWIVIAFLFFLFFFSDIARFGSQASINTLNFSPKSLILLVGFYLSRRFLPDGMSPVYSTDGVSTETFKPFLIFSLFCVGITVLLIALLCKKGFKSEAFIWAGVSFFSISGAMMVYIGRGVIVPAERHSPGSDGFWVAFIALSITYLATFKENSKNTGIHNSSIRRILLSIMLSTVGILSLARSAYAFSQQTTGKGLTFFPKLCVDSTKAHPLLRDRTFRHCFPFADERSTYQLSIMEMAGMSGRNLTRPVFNNNEIIVIALMPSQLMATFTDRFLLKTPSTAHAQQGRVYYFVPARETYFSPSTPTPATKDMNWNYLGKDIQNPATIKNLEQLRGMIEKVNPRQDILLISATELSTEQRLVNSYLANSGFLQVPNQSLNQVNRQFPSFTAVCFQSIIYKTNQSRVNICANRLVDVAISN